MIKYETRGIMKLGMVVGDVIVVPLGVGGFKASQHSDMGSCLFNLNLSPMCRGDSINTLRSKFA